MSGSSRTSMRWRWLWLSISSAVLFGVWGALIELPQKLFPPGFPATLGYIVWSLVMVPCAAVALERARWHVDRSGRAIAYGLSAGLLGAAGQLLVFEALVNGPAYLIFPIISLAPAVTVLLSVGLLRERTHLIAGVGVLLSLAAIPLLSVQPAASEGPLVISAWLAAAAGALVMWGAQGFLIKASQTALNTESLFFYMTIGALLLCPVAWWMTDWSAPVNWSLSGPYLMALIQALNAIGALLYIYALRSGKALIVAPTINGLFPVLTIALSLALYAQIPGYWNGLGMVLSIIAVVLMSRGEALKEDGANKDSGPGERGQAHAARSDAMRRSAAGAT